MSASDDNEQPFEVASRTYFGSLENAGVDEALKSRAAEDYAAYVRELEAASPPQEVQDRMATAFRRYVDTLAEAWASSGAATQATDAYRSYVKELRHAWDALDEGALNAPLLGQIAHSIQVVAWNAAITDAAVAAHDQSDTPGTP